MREELALTCRQQIFERQEAGKKADAEWVDRTIANVETKRLTGHLLADFRATLSDDEFKMATDFMELEAVKNYIRFAKHNPDPITELDEAFAAIALALKLTGTIPFPDGHGEQHLHEPNVFSKYDGLIGSAVAMIWHFIQRRPVNNWPGEQVRGLRASNEPVMKLCHMLDAELESRGA